MLIKIPSEVKIMIYKNDKIIIPQHNDSILLHLLRYSHKNYDKIPILNCVKDTGYVFVCKGSVTPALYPATLCINEKKETMHCYVNLLQTNLSHLPVIDISDSRDVFTCVEKVIDASEDDPAIKQAMMPSNKIIDDFKTYLFMYFYKFYYTEEEANDNSGFVRDDVYAKLSVDFKMNIQPLTTLNVNKNIFTVYTKEDLSGGLYHDDYLYYVKKYPAYKDKVRDYKQFDWYNILYSPVTLLLIANLYHTVFMSTYAACKKYVSTVVTNKEDVKKLADSDIKSW